MSVFLTRLLDELADEIYPEGRQFIDTDSATFHVRKEWANKLRAIRAAVGGEAVAAAWMLRRKRDDFVRGCYATKPTAESLEFAELDGDYYTPLYASPTATVDVGALRELELLRDAFKQWRAFGGIETGLCDELAALIGKEA